jgi:hypothetical protein
MSGCGKLRVSSALEAASNRLDSSMSWLVAKSLKLPQHLVHLETEFWQTFGDERVDCLWQLKKDCMEIILDELIW